MAMVSPLSLFLLLILTECCWASTASIVTTPSPLPDTVSVPVSDLSSSISPLSLESLQTSNSDTVLMFSSTLDAGPVTFLTTEAKDGTSTSEMAFSTTLAPITSDGTSTSEVAFSTTLAPITSGLPQVDKENPSSTQELATHTSTLAASVSDAVTMATTPFSTPLPSDTPVREEEASITEQENTSLVSKETTSSEIISAYTTTSTVTRSFQASQTTSTSSISLTNVSPANKLKQEGGNSLLVILVVVVLVAALLVALFLLWRQRQKRRTGALMLVGSGKHKGAGDAWAGPVQVTEDQAASGPAAVEGETGKPEGEGTGRRPTLTTFFGRRKSRQGSVMLEDLEAGTTTNNLKDESEPLVENMDGTVKPPAANGSSADGSGAEDGNLPSAPVTKV
ncbi:leukosialin [Petaurus breviceps papuanus]|uniref:leukosialin n=1 Tax=Petaurus breviceps papuanus TaxID=3040969 RepID=UPI0036D84FEA